MAKETEINPRKLIVLVKNYPMLYNAASHDFKFHSQKENAWKEIGSKLNAHGNYKKYRCNFLLDTSYLVY